MKKTIRYQSQLLERRSYKPMRILREGLGGRVILVLRPAHGCGAKPRLEHVPDHNSQASG